jgi:hypothetical protein
MRIAIISILFLSGCVNASLLCPDLKSTVSYCGLALTGTTSISCVQSLTGGDVAQVSGLDLSALAAMIAPMVMAEPQPQRTPDSKQDEKFNL